MTEVLFFSIKRYLEHLNILYSYFLFHLFDGF